MKLPKLHLGLIGAITLLTLAGSFIWVSSLEEPSDSAVAFVSIGLDQATLSAEVSPYEILRANEHFSDIVLGWTVEPGFADEFDFSFTGQRQEKQNLIFTVEGVSNIDPARELVSLISSRLAGYNEIAHSSYQVALVQYSVVEGERAESRLVLGATLLTFLLSLCVSLLISGHFWNPTKAG